MKKLITIIGAILLLAGCQSTQTTKTTQPVKTTNSWKGTWITTTPNSAEKLTILKANKKVLNFELKAFVVKNPKEQAHVGNIKGQATIKGNTAIFNDAQTQCKVNFTNTKNKINVKTSPECSQFGGEGVTFEATYKQQKTPDWNGIWDLPGSIHHNELFIYNKTDNAISFEIDGEKSIDPDSDKTIIKSIMGEAKLEGGIASYTDPETKCTLDFKKGLRDPERIIVDTNQQCIIPQNEGVIFGGTYQY